MESRELQEIKARAEQVKKLLGSGSDTLHLIEDNLPRLVAEVERLRTELEQAGKCPHGGFYKDRTCVECFGDGTEEMRECGECRTKTWHRGGKCLRHDAAPKPYEQLRAELKQLQGEIQTVQEQSSTRVAQAEERAKKIEAEAERLRAGLKRLQDEIQTVQEESSTRATQAEERVKEIEATCVAMREALGYVKGRIGSTNIGESLIKIDRALSSSTGDRTMEDKKGTE